MPEKKEVSIFNYLNFVIAFLTVIYSICALDFYQVTDSEIIHQLVNY